MAPRAPDARASPAEPSPPSLTRRVPSRTRGPDMAPSPKTFAAPRQSRGAALSMLQPGAEAAKDPQPSYRATSGRSVWLSGRLGQRGMGFAGLGGVQVARDVVDGLLQRREVLHDRAERIRDAGPLGAQELQFGPQLGDLPACVGQLGPEPLVVLVGHLQPPAHAVAVVEIGGDHAADQVLALLEPAIRPLPVLQTPLA